MLAIVGASGRLGLATLNALLEHSLISPNQIVCTTSSSAGAQRLDAARQKGVHVRSADWDDAKSFEAALAGCDRLFLISSSRIAKDFGNAAMNMGREADHYIALQAARNVKVKHFYYTSLALGKPSKSRVMKAHERTEEWIKAGIKNYTLIREGIYSESWPLWLGHYAFPNDDRAEIHLGGDGKVCWTSIADLGLANALILAAPSEQWTRKIVYLAQSKSHTLAEVATMVSKAKGGEIQVKFVDRETHEKYYVEERGMDEKLVKWWSKTYDALNVNEAEIHDPTLETLLAQKGVEPKRMEEVVEQMFQA